MNVKDFLIDLKNYIGEQDEFHLSVLKENKELFGYEIIYGHPFYNKNSKLSSKFLHNKENMNITEISCSTGRCDYLDSVTQINFIIDDKKDKPFSDIVSDFINKYKDNEYFTEYVNIVKNYYDINFSKTDYDLEK